MQAITTKYLGPTNYYGSRIKATCEAGSATVSRDHGASNGTTLSEKEANNDLAARALIEKLGWYGTWARGDTAEGCVYVCLMREVEGRTFKTPHPQSADPCGLLIVRSS